MAENTEHAVDVPDRWLRTFTEVARTGSFTAAGERLGVSQPAISHTIARLERSIGSSLFIREKSGAQLTVPGTQLIRSTGPAFDQIDEAVATVRKTVLDDMSVAISVSTSLASYWLMPRLHLFKAEFTEIDLRVITNDTDRGVGQDDADLWIPLGRGPWPQLQSWELFAERIYPVASPKYQMELSLKSALEAPSHIHLEERYTPRFDWSAWTTSQNSEVAAQRGPTSNDYSLVIQSAIEGQGVALGWHHIVGPLVSEGRLVRIGLEEVNTEASFPVLAKRGPLRPAAKQMLDWLLKEAS